MSAEAIEGVRQPPVEQTLPNPEPRPSNPTQPRRLGGLGRILGAGLLSVLVSRSTGDPISQTSLTESGGTIPSSPTLQVDSVAELKTTDKIINFIGENGKRDLTFEQARDIVPAITSLFSNTGKRFTGEEMAKKLFVVESGISKADSKLAKRKGFSLDYPDANFKMPLFKALHEDYPDINPGSDIDGKVVISIYKLLRYADTVGFTQDDLVFVFLRATNGVKRFANIIDLQFNDFSDKRCTEATPSVMFISTALHELVHLNSPIINAPVSQVMIDNSKFLDLGFTPSESVRNGFSLYFSSYDETEGSMDYQSAALNGLDEFVVQHIANKISADNGIPIATIGINAPKDSANFQAILDQAGISLEELTELHRSSDIDGFLVKVAEGAKEMVFNTREEKIAFGLKLFAPLINNYYAWETPFGKYFPSVDTQYYRTNKRPNRIQGFAGCGNPHIRTVKH